MKYYQIIMIINSHREMRGLVIAFIFNLLEGSFFLVIFILHATNNLTFIDNNIYFSAFLNEINNQQHLQTYQRYQYYYHGAQVKMAFIILILGMICYFMVLVSLSGFLLILKKSGTRRKIQTKIKKQEFSQLKTFHRKIVLFIKLMKSLGIFFSFVYFAYIVKFYFGLKQQPQRNSLNLELHRQQFFSLIALATLEISLEGLEWIIQIFIWKWHKSIREQEQNFQEFNQFLNESLYLYNKKNEKIKRRHLNFFIQEEQQQQYSQQLQSPKLKQISNIKFIKNNKSNKQLIPIPRIVISESNNHEKYRITLNNKLLLMQQQYQEVQNYVSNDNNDNISNSYLKKADEYELEQQRNIKKLLQKINFRQTLIYNHTQTQSPIVQKSNNAHKDNDHNDNKNNIENKNNKSKKNTTVINKKDKKQSNKNLKYNNNNILDELIVKQKRQIQSIEMKNMKMSIPESLKINSSQKKGSVKQKKIEII